jgi:hypothetical protein
VEWIGEVDTTADDAVAGERSQPKQAVADVAAAWLVEKFTERRQWCSEELFAAAKAKNISRDAIFKAKKLLGWPTAKKITASSGAVTWTWSVPDNWNPPTGPTVATVEHENDTRGF